MRSISFSLILLGFYSQFALSLASKDIPEECHQFSKPQLVAFLEHEKIDESSGLALSSAFPNRFYHINDSGDQARLYQTNFDLKKNTTPLPLKTSTIKIDQWTAVDAEALAYGPCPGQMKSKCIFIGDIGDNLVKRKYVEIIVIEEKENYPQKVQPLYIKKIIYPEGATNAEGMAIHPHSGDLFILTKNEDLKKMKAFPSQIVKIPSQSFLKKIPFIKAKQWGVIDTPSFTSDLELWGQITTGMDIHPSGKNFVYSTYRKNILVDHDLNEAPLPTTDELLKNDKIKLFEQLMYPQVESIAYSLDGKSLFNTSEFHKSAGVAPLTQSSCALK
jgi:hypothetical protein